MAARTTDAQDAELRLQLEYEPLKTETLRSLSGKLRAHGLQLPEDDLDEYYNQAWHALYAQLASGTEIANTGGFLVQVGYRRAIDELRRDRLDERADVPLEAAAIVEPDLAGRLEDRRMLREFTEALRDELGERERVAASLCYLHGYARPEAAKLMGLNERRMQKVMDNVSKAIGRITREIERGERCEGRASVNKAYALGLLDPVGERHAAARAHLDACARCRADVLGLRGLAAAAPPTLLPWATIHAGGGGADTAAGKARHASRTGAATAAVAVAVVVVAAVSAFALSRDGSDLEVASAPSRQAAAASKGLSRAADPPSSTDASRSPGAPPRNRPSQPGAGDAAEVPPTPLSPPPASVPSSSHPVPEPRATEQRHRERQAERRRRRAEEPPTAPAPAATPVPTPVPTPIATPVPPPPAATPTPSPPVLDDGSQEFGVER